MKNRKELLYSMLTALSANDKTTAAAELKEYFSRIASAKINESRYPTPSYGRDKQEITGGNVQIGPFTVDISFQVEIEHLEGQQTFGGNMEQPPEWADNENVGFGSNEECVCQFANIRLNGQPVEGSHFTSFTFSLGEDGNVDQEGTWNFGHVFDDATEQGSEFDKYIASKKEEAFKAIVAGIQAEISAEAKHFGSRPTGY